MYDSEPDLLVRMPAKRVKGRNATRVMEMAEGAPHGPQYARVLLLVDAGDDRLGPGTGERALLDRHVPGRAELAQDVGAEGALVGVGAVEQPSRGAKALLAASRVEQRHMLRALVAVRWLGERVPR